jgi:hypothetical protein
MDYSALTARLDEWKTELKRVLEAGTSAPAVTGAPEWYAGLAVSPASFSQQLGDMQIAMLSAGTKHSRATNAGDTVETAR